MYFTGQDPFLGIYRFLRSLEKEQELTVARKARLEAFIWHQGLRTDDAFQPGSLLFNERSLIENCFFFPMEVDQL
jgi:hypothetical protein